MAQGKSNAAISDSLYISPSGVEKHINATFAKLMLSSEDGAQHRRVAAVLTFSGTTPCIGGGARPRGPTC